MTDITQNKEFQFLLMIEGFDIRNSEPNNHSPLRKFFNERLAMQGEQHERQAEELKQEVRKLLEVTTEPLARLELIDRFQRLGIGYHFEREIKNALEAISVKDMDEKDLYATALRFRLLRQHGFKVTSGMQD